MNLKFRDSLFVAVIALQLSSCVSCREASFYKYIANQENHAVWTNFQRPNFAYFDVANKATFTVGICGGSNYIPQPKDADRICLDVLLDEQTVMQLQDARILLTNSEGEQTFTPIQEINYVIQCQVKPTGERTCTSSELSPVKGTTPTITKANRGINNNFADVYHFAPDCFGCAP